MSSDFHASFGSVTDPLAALSEKLAAVAEALGVRVDGPNDQQLYRLAVEGIEVRLQLLASGQVIVSVPLGIVGDLAANRSESVAQLLGSHMNLHGARLSRLALPYAVSIEPAQDELILWIGYDVESQSSAPLDQVVEELLNEAEFRLNWLGVASRS